MKYLTVGTDEIKTELFRPVEDTDKDSIKPRGGLWLTRYDNEFYNEWVEFMLDDPVILFYKNRHNSIWNQPCSLVTLRDSVNLFYLKTNEDLEFLKNNYLLEEDKFSYSEISHIYDGIFVDIYSLLREVKEGKTRERLFKFGVNSLNLFNLDCIEYYQSGIVKIEPFDFEAGLREAQNYEICIETEKKRILKK